MLNRQSIAHVYKGHRIEDTFMWQTVLDIVIDEHKKDTEIAFKVYQELYKQTDEQGKSWNCSMIDRLVEKLG